MKLKRLALSVGASLLFAGCTATLQTCGAVDDVASAPARVISKTVKTDNVIASYEWFHDANGQYEARVAQVRVHKSMMADEKDERELRRLRIELVGMEQTCRDLAVRYNANSAKANKRIFRDHNLPEMLSMEACQ